MRVERQLRILVTGGAGFIGSALVIRLVREGHEVLNVDLLTYAGDIANLDEIDGAANHRLFQADIADSEAMEGCFADFRPERVFHLAAESHVDRSIDGPEAFIRTNISGTYALLEAAHRLWRAMPEEDAGAFRFVHVSTDEVYGALGETGLFSEDTPYAPNSPYSASKASSDFLARSWWKTYGLPTVVTNCSNNYGPRQNQEKLIPTIIRNALGGHPIPIYGDGSNVRDWLYVEDHIDALWAAAKVGRIGERYNIGGHNEIRNIEIARAICAVLDERRPKSAGCSYADQISFVTDRPGHDFRYAIDPTKATRELGWTPSQTFETGIRKTIDWFLANVRDDDELTSERLGLARA